MRFRALWDIISGPAFIIDSVGCVSWLQCCQNLHNWLVLMNWSISIYHDSSITRRKCVHSSHPLQLVKYFYSYKKMYGKNHFGPHLEIFTCCSPKSVTKSLQLSTKMIYTFSCHELSWTSCNVWLEWTSCLLVSYLHPTRCILMLDVSRLKI